ncbi:MAG: hypothetical protein RL373_461 [Pseudomonadota bacterium]|jgi:acyl-coenzyme A thioesterase PaaI-like protein
MMNDQQLKQKYLELGWDTFTDEGFVEIAGPFFFKKDVNCMHFLFETTIKHQNRNQVLQGGALTTFVDRAFGAAARELTQANKTTTIQLNMNFLDSVKIGEIARLTPEITRSTKQIVFLSGNVMVDDRLVASATGIWKKIL